MTMRERIADGKLFTDDCEGMPEERRRCKVQMAAFNASSPDDPQERARIMTELFGRETKAWIEPPFYCCYGTHITIGDGTYVNFNCSFVDDGKITIGSQVLFGPAVTIATVGHPVNPEMRRYMYADPVTIGDNRSRSCHLSGRDHREEQCNRSGQRRYRGHPRGFGGRRQPLPRDSCHQ